MKPMGIMSDPTLPPPGSAPASLAVPVGRDHLHPVAVLPHGRGARSLVGGDVTLTAIVALGCRACASSATVEAPADLCPSSPFHVHVKISGDNPVAAWYRSHHQPGSTIVAVRKKGTP